MELKLIKIFATLLIYLQTVKSTSAAEISYRELNQINHNLKSHNTIVNLFDITRLRTSKSFVHHPRHTNDTLLDEQSTTETNNDLNKQEQTPKTSTFNKIKIYKSISNKRRKRDINVTASTNLTNLVEDGHLLDENGTKHDANCTNEYCISDEDYINMIDEYMFPTSYEWVLIVLHSFVFLIGLIGNALVCVAVYRNHSMRTVTNYFIVNLAVADFMVILFCLPPTVLWDITETWFLGEALCKIVPYLQTVSVTVSVLTLTFISADRWYAICFPLKFKSTTNRAKTGILIIWLVALVFDIPELVVLTTIKRLERVDTHYFIQCDASWSQDSDTNWSVIKMIALYTFPLSFMSVAYFQIVRVLWQSDNIPGQMVVNTGSLGRNNTFTMNSNASTEGQLRSRRKAAKMLVAVVIMFAVCYFPVHLFSVMRITMQLPQNDINTALALLSHWMCYANSAVNPVIYNFMSGNFRREFRRAFAQCCHSTNTRTSYQLKSMSGRNMTSTSYMRDSRRPLASQTIVHEQKLNART